MVLEFILSLFSLSRKDEEENGIDKFAYTCTLYLATYNFTFR